jgi:hypothetical protein
MLLTKNGFEFLGFLTRPGKPHATKECRYCSWVKTKYAKDLEAGCSAMENGPFIDHFPK